MPLLQVFYLGHFNPAAGVAMQPLGKYFIEIIKIFIYPIILVTIITGICGMDSLKRVGMVGGKALLYFEVVTTVALLIGVVVAHFIQPGAGVDTTLVSKGDISKYNGNASISWLQFLKDNITIQVLLFALVAGMIISKQSNKIQILKPINFASKYIFKGLHIVMKAAPIGAFGGMAYTIGKYGIATLFPLAKLMICVYLTMGLFIFLILGSLLSYYKISIWKFLGLY